MGGAFRWRIIWLDLACKHVFRTLTIKLVDIGRPNPPWAALFHRLEVLNCIRRETEQQASTWVCMHSFFSGQDMDVILLAISNSVAVSSSWKWTITGKCELKGTCCPLNCLLSRNSITPAYVKLGHFANTDLISFSKCSAFISTLDVPHREVNFFLKLQYYFSKHVHIFTKILLYSKRHSW